MKYSYKVKNFIDTNYMMNIRIDEIAHDLILNREYLSRCFKRDMGLIQLINLVLRQSTVWQFTYDHTSDANLKSDICRIGEIVYENVF